MLSCNTTTQVPTPSPTTITDLSLMDRSWLTGEPCEAPCWYGLELGKTTKDEAVSTVMALSFIDYGNISKLDRYWDHSVAQQLSFGCKLPAGAICTSFIFVDDTLVYIHLTPNYPITFGEVVEQIGEPDFIGAEYTVPETRDCAAELIWLDRQMQVIYYEFHRSSGRDLCGEIIDAGNKPPSDLVVHNVMYLLPDYFKDVPVHNQHYSWQGFAEP